MGVITALLEAQKAVNASFADLQHIFAGLDSTVMAVVRQMRLMEHRDSTSVLQAKLSSQVRISNALQTDNRDLRDESRIMGRDLKVLKREIQDLKKPKRPNAQASETSHAPLDVVKRKSIEHTDLDELEACDRFKDGRCKSNRCKFSHSG
jgi:hypothetical protein